MAGSRIPGPLGTPTNTPPIDVGTLARTNSPVPNSLNASCPPAVSVVPTLDNDTRMLAATAYGEASEKNVFEEMAAIAIVLVRQQKARSHASISAFIKVDKTFTFAAHDGNKRYAKLMTATEAEIAKDQGMASALKAAQNALSSTGIDYSNGAYFWDGADVKTNYDKHKKVIRGIRITNPAHNIYGIKDKDVSGERYWEDAKGKPTKLRGKWTHIYESTAAYGGTIFWKYNTDFLKATGN